MSQESTCHRFSRNTHEINIPSASMLFCTLSAQREAMGQCISMLALYEQRAHAGQRAQHVPAEMFIDLP
jgi:hypothetical protein